LEFRSREILFREAIIAFLGADPGEKEQGCNQSQKERCRLEFGDFLDWACKKCESNPVPGEKKNG